MSMTVIGTSRIFILPGDITEQRTDAIVNAANSTLMGGRGVDGAIHRKGGTEILEECKTIRKIKWPEGLPIGEAVETTGGRLKAKSVIHTVGPIWNGGIGGEAQLLAKAYGNCLALALKMKIRSISFHLSVLELTDIRLRKQAGLHFRLSLILLRNIRGSMRCISYCTASMI